MLELFVIGLGVYIFRSLYLFLLKKIFKKQLFLTANTLALVSWSSLKFFRNDDIDDILGSILGAIIFAVVFAISDYKESKKSFEEKYSSLLKKDLQGKNWVSFMSGMSWLLMIFFGLFSVVYFLGYLNSSPRIWIELVPIILPLFFTIYPIYKAKTLKKEYEEYINKKTDK